ncbi:chemotaxis protein CheD [Bremerella sp. JC817]|uniref:chemotaxis protein CheD n=1 Tax=Bremerella sp. JC817 TaxID=3231756 RepID=UPI003459040A
MHNHFHHRSIIVGEVFASDHPSIVTTVLGSCVAACLFDPIAKIGGMNHFMLPQAKRESTSAAYGIHAMELLINKIMSLGGDRRRFKAKVFGGGNVLDLRAEGFQVGTRNVAFVHQFLADEGIELVAERVGGNQGVKICFYTDTGKVLLKPVANRQMNDMIRQEVQSLREPNQTAAQAAGAVTLFD